MTNPAFWRRWHRWIAFPASIFLLFAALTGVAVAITEFFGDEEALREATREMTSPVRTDAIGSAWHDQVARALAGAAREAPGAPIDRIQIQFKATPATISVFLGKPGGGEDRRLTFDLATGALIGTAAYVDKPLIHRIHSGEAFGDGGLVVAMMWGTVLAFLTISGFVIYLTMRRKNPSAWQRVFW
ncbi:MAG TPA: PepSY-associated TM helix domain-containing protein [Vicinamibacterales bacterium]